MRRRLLLLLGLIGCGGPSNTLSFVLDGERLAFDLQNVWSDDGTHGIEGRVVTPGGDMKHAIFAVRDQTGWCELILGVNGQFGLELYTGTDGANCAATITEATSDQVAGTFTGTFGAGDMARDVTDGRFDFEPFTPR